MPVSPALLNPARSVSSALALDLPSLPASSHASMIVPSMLSAHKLTRNTLGGQMSTEKPPPRGKNRTIFATVLGGFISGIVRALADWLLNRY